MIAMLEDEGIVSKEEPLENFLRDPDRRLAVELGLDEEFGCGLGSIWPFKRPTNGILDDGRTIIDHQEFGESWSSMA